MLRTGINLTSGIFDRGYSKKTVAKITGENWLRVFRECWQVDINLSWGDLFRSLLVASWMVIRNVGHRLFLQLMSLK